MREFVRIGAVEITSIGLDQDNIFPVRSRVVESICVKLGTEICRKCERQVVKECKASLAEGEVRAPAVPATVLSS